MYALEQSEWRRRRLEKRRRRRRRRSLGPGSVGPAAGRRWRPAARSRRDPQAQPGPAEAGDAGGPAFPVRCCSWLRCGAAAVLGFYAFTFRVNPDELGVVMRFGEYVRQEPPGLHFRLPYPIEEVLLPKVTRQNIIEIGMRSAATGRSYRYGSPRRARGKPDADGRREHRRRRLRRVLAHQDAPIPSGQTVRSSTCSTSRTRTATVKEVAESAMREIVGKSRHPADADRRPAEDRERTSRR